MKRLIMLSLRSGSTTLSKELMQISRFSTETPKTGIVMMNMGGPQNIDDVYNYLYKIMTDRDMIQFPFMQNKMGPWIANKRTPELQKKYKEIGGGSPILKWTKRQGELLCQQLDKVSPSSAPHKFYVSFRYCKPLTEDALTELERDGVKRAVIFSQYPQYSCATSGSSFNEIFKFYQKREFPKELKLSIIDRWATHPLLIKTFADLISKELQQISEKNRKDAVILFSAHSLPLKTVNRGDSYPFEVGASVQLVMKELKFCNPHQLVWQSKVGPLPWLGPFTDEAMKSYVIQGKKALLLVPIAFVNEHIETLHEMDIEYCQDLASKIKLEEVRRVPAPNDHCLFIDALTNLVKSHLEKGPSVSRKFLNRCPHCVNQNCINSKNWYFKICNM